MPRWTTKDSNFRTFLLVAQLDERGLRARIREARLTAGLTQQELADLLEVHKRTVENYERVRVPDFKTLVRIAAVLERPVEWFLHGGEREADPSRSQDVTELAGEVRELRRLLESLHDEFAALSRLLRESRADAPTPPASRART